MQLTAADEQVKGSKGIHIYLRRVHHIHQMEYPRIIGFRGRIYVLVTIVRQMINRVGIRDLKGTINLADSG